MSVLEFLRIKLDPSEIKSTLQFYAACLTAWVIVIIVIFLLSGKKCDIGIPYVSFPVFVLSVSFALLYMVLKFSSGSKPLEPGPDNPQPRRRTKGKMPTEDMEKQSKNQSSSKARDKAKLKKMAQLRDDLEDSDLNAWAEKEVDKDRQR